MDPESFQSRRCNLYLDVAVEPLQCLRVLSFDLSLQMYMVYKGRLRELGLTGLEKEGWEWT